MSWTSIPDEATVDIFDPGVPLQLTQSGVASLAEAANEMARFAYDTGIQEGASRIDVGGRSLGVAIQRLSLVAGVGENEYLVAAVAENADIRVRPFGENERLLQFLDGIRFGEFASGRRLLVMQVSSSREVTQEDAIALVRLMLADEAEDR